jgi:hypothetical protein
MLTRKPHLPGTLITLYFVFLLPLQAADRNIFTLTASYPESVELKYQHRFGNLYCGLTSGLLHYAQTRALDAGSPEILPSVDIGYYFFNLPHTDIGLDFTSYTLYKTEFSYFGGNGERSTIGKNTYVGYALRPTVMFTFRHFVLQAHLGGNYQQTYLYSNTYENGSKRSETKLEGGGFELTAGGALGFSF